MATVTLEEYLDLAREYHVSCEHVEEFEDCEEGRCDYIHYIAWNAAEYQNLGE